MRHAGWSARGLVFGTMMGCAGPALDLPEARPGGFELVLEPSAPQAALPMSFRARVRSAPSGQAWLFRGELSDYHDSALRRDELPRTLRERAVPLRYWREGGDCVLQPLVWLEPGMDYGLAFAGHGRAAALRTSGELEPRAERYFPAGELEGAVTLCGAEFSAALPAQASLEPGGIPLEISRGVFGVERTDCVTVVASRAPDEPAVLPPSLAGVLLEPSLLAASRTIRAQALPECSGDQSVAGACLRVEDDRVLVRTGERASLWLLTEPQHVALTLDAFERAPLLTGLEPGSSYTLAGRVVQASGDSSPLTLHFETPEPRRHLVLNEVLANAAGSEPDSEWVELVNDSARPVSLSGLRLEDAGGAFPLPEGELLPGEHALLVGASFRASALDVPPAPSTRLLRLPSLGARGLSNSGEPLLLVGREGVLSRFPAISAGTAGRSVARRSLPTADDDPRGFVEHAPPGASPGAPNSLE